MDLSADYNRVIDETKLLKKRAYDRAVLLAYTIKRALKGTEYTGRIEHLEPKQTDAAQVVEFDVFSGGGGDPEHDDYRRSTGMIEIAGSGHVRISLKDQDSDLWDVSAWDSDLADHPPTVVAQIITRIQERDSQGVVGPVLSSVTPFQKNGVPPTSLSGQNPPAP